MAKRGLRVQDIRAREVRRGPLSDQSLELRRFEYETTVSQELFLSFESGDALLGFCRSLYRP